MLTLVSSRTVHASCTSKLVVSTNQQARQAKGSPERPSFLMLLLRALGSIHS
jgi:hypothetical protein